MRLSAAVCFVLVLTLSTLAFADFTYVGKLPFTRPCPTCPVLGMASTEWGLFVTAATDTIQWLYRIDASDGAIFEIEYWDFHDPTWPRFESASYAGNDIFWVGEQNGDLIRFEWVDGVVTPLDTLSEDRIYYPKGMFYRDMGEAIDENVVADAEWDSVFTVRINGGVTGSADLGALTFMGYLSPTSASQYGGRYYFAGESHPDSVFETNAAMERVDAHHLPIPAGFSPQAATFHNGLYYVGGMRDSIFIYSMGSYAGEVPEGPDVSVEIVFERLTISFDSVAVAGSLFVREIADTCPAPGGVVFFGDFYDVSTTAQFDYITTVEMMTNDPLPSDVMPRRVRVFKRPSATCSYWRDITVQELQVEDPPRTLEPFRVNTRTLSEDDEFSIFTLGEDNRSPRFVIGLKYGYLEAAISENQDSIPNDTYNVLMTLLTDSEAAYGNMRYGQAARLANRIANVTRATPAIPHRYEPGTGRINVAGRIIARAHTLAFSLGQLISQGSFGSGGAISTGQPATAVDPAPMNTLIAGPNPSATGFTVKLSGTARRPVSVKVYSVEGELVTTLLENGVVNGERSLTWKGLNASGQPVSAGTYFVVVTEGESTTTRKVVLRK